MTQYLIRHITDSTGHPFTHVTKARDNETFTVVEAESKGEAERKASDKKQCPNCESWNTDIEYAYALSKPILTIFKCYNCGFKDDWKFKEDDQ